MAKNINRFLFVFLFAVCFIAFSSSVWAARAIKIDVNSGPYGTTITVTGTGFNPNNNTGETVTVKYGDANHVSDVAIAANGTFSTTIDANGEIAGNYTVQAFEYGKAGDYVAKSNALTFKQTSGKKATNAVFVEDFPNTIEVAPIDLKGKRIGSIQTFQTCLGENSQCFAAGTAAFTQASGAIIVSTPLSFQDNTSTLFAQQFNLNFQNNQFSVVQAIDGPNLTKFASRPCYQFYNEGNKTLLMHYEDRGNNDVQFGGSLYDPTKPGIGRFKNYLPKTNGPMTRSCFGTDVVHVEVVSNDVGTTFLQYKDHGVSGQLQLPTFPNSGFVASADMTYRESSHSGREILAMNVLYPTASNKYSSQVFDVQLDVSNAHQWEIVGEPVALSKAHADVLWQSRYVGSVKIAPHGNFVVFTGPSASSGAVWGCYIDPITGQPISKASKLFKRSRFHGPYGPVGLSITQIF